MLSGLYCISVAHVIITNIFPIGFKLNDHDLIRIAKDVNLNCLLMFLKNL